MNIAFSNIRCKRIEMWLVIIRIKFHETINESMTRFQLSSMDYYYVVGNSRLWMIITKWDLGRGGTPLCRTRDFTPLFIIIWMLVGVSYYNAEVNFYILILSFKLQMLIIIQPILEIWYFLYSFVKLLSKENERCNFVDVVNLQKWRWYHKKWYLVRK